jgi:hypothetical protein
MGCPDDKANLTTSVERTVRIGLRADESGSVEEYLPPLAPALEWGTVQVDGIVGDQTGRCRSPRSQQLWKAK